MESLANFPSLPSRARDNFETGVAPRMQKLSFTSCRRVVSANFLLLPCRKDIQHERTSQKASVLERGPVALRRVAADRASRGSSRSGGHRAPPTGETWRKDWRVPFLHRIQPAFHCKRNLASAARVQSRSVQIHGSSRRSMRARTLPPISSCALKCSAQTNGGPFMRSRDVERNGTCRPLQS